ncbi:MAG: hypothetical protein DMF78_00720 [Acidobacteria bacterium]|nr:MAG: hypothetical protein DMF78_00720 [Acidobacteriota bacterium]
MRHFCRNSSRMAEIRVPAWPMPIHQTKLTMANEPPQGRAALEDEAADLLGDGGEVVAGGEERVHLRVGDVHGGLLAAYRGGDVAGDRRRFPLLRCFRLLSHGARFPPAPARLGSRGWGS